jgi:ornithine cyclodeaminase/alanine dehydrogenase-like protein (mu-crystallin family)
VSDQIRYLDATTVAALLDEIDAVAVIEDALRLHATGATVLPAEAHLHWSTVDGAARSLALPAVLGDPPYAAGTKVMNGNLANPARGLPRASGLVLLFDVRTAQVSTVMAAAQVSATRTAAVSAAAARALAPKPMRQLLILGAGPIGEAHTRLLPRALPSVREIWVYDLDHGRARTVADTAHATAVARRDDVIGAADLIIAATTSREPYLDLAEVPAGCLVVNVGLDDCTEDLLLGADQLVVDDWTLVAEDPHRLLGRLIRAGKVTGPVLELAQVVAHQNVTVRPTDRVVVNPFGLAIHDVALASAVDQLARQRGLGISLPR